MLNTTAHGDKLNEFYYLPKKEAKFFIIKKIDGEGYYIVKNGVVINMFSLLYFEPWFVFKLKVPDMRKQC